MTKLSLFFLSGALVLAACSTTPSSSSAGTCSSYVSAVRDSSQRCKKTSTPPDEATQEARLATLCTNALNAPGNGITSSAVQACADALKGTCDTPDVCESLSATTGTLPDGTACGADAQCTGGDCRKDPGGTGCGKCAQRIPIGGPCGTGAGKCVRGASCASKDGTSGASTCVATAKVGEGEVCYDPTKPSSSFATCASGLTCKIGGGSGTTPVKCVKRAAAGEACSQSGDCISELACIAGKCAARLADGEACTSTGDCATGACSKETKKCVPYEYGAAGAACNNDDKRCARGSCSRTSSSSADGKCVDPIPDGAPCTAASDSSSGPDCDTYATCIQGTCQLFDPATCK